MYDVAIIGGGISGLYLAKLLSDAQIEYAIFEARDRLGGRILTHQLDHATDLGPTWIWPEDQPRISCFLHENNISTSAQWQSGKSLYQSDRSAAPQAFIDEQTYANAIKVVGGNANLVKTLYADLDKTNIHTDHILKKVSDQSDHVRLEIQNNGQTLHLSARKVILAMPPRLIGETVQFLPELSHRIQQVMSSTPTWMASHAKAVIHYDNAFWREKGLSGNAYCQYPGAALMEIYDDSSTQVKSAALSGFFGLPASLRHHYRHDLTALITEQLTRLFGAEAANPKHIEIQDWYNEPFTATSLDEVPPESHPDYGHPYLQLDHWNDKLYFSGTETAKQFGGYIEGALEAAERVASALILSDQTDNWRTTHATT